MNNWQTFINPREWQFYKTCTCGGVLKHKYKLISNEQTELHILPNRNKFKILENGRLKKEGVLSELEN